MAPQNFPSHVVCRFEINFYYVEESCWLSSHTRQKSCTLFESSWKNHSLIRSKVDVITFCQVSIAFDLQVPADNEAHYTSLSRV